MAASKNYVGVAPLTMVNVGPGGYAYVYAGQPVPEGASAEEIKRLVDGEFIAEGEPGGSTSDSGSSNSRSIKEILKEVGEDQTKAAAALEAENAKGDDARPTLVAKLEAIANPPGPDDE